MGRKRKEPEISLPKIEQLPSGAYHTRVLIDGRRVSVTKDTYDECVAEYLALKNKITKAKESQFGKSVTLETAVKNYIAARDGFCSPSTIRGYQKFERNFFQDLMKRNIFSISGQQWQNGIRRLHEQGKSSKYIKNGWMFFASCLKAAGAVPPDVLLYPPEEREHAFLEPEEIDKFVEAIKGHRFEIPFLMCLSSLRRSELLAMDWKNIDLEHQVMRVRGAVVVGPDGLVEKKQNKTQKSRRSIPIIPPLLEALKKEQKKTGKIVKVNADTIYNDLQKVCAATGITIVNLHGLRHSFASLAYHLQIPEMIAAEIGGWNDLSTMHKIYTHLAQRDIAKRCQDFCNYFAPEAMKKRQIGNTIGNDNSKTQ